MVMTKQKKKRTKQYTGQDAVKGPVVHRYTAEAKSPAREWWDAHKRRTKLITGVVVGAVVLGWLLFEFFGLIFN